MKLVAALFVEKQKKEVVHKTAFEKFCELRNKLKSEMGKKYILRKYHFSLIEDGKEKVLFDGEGKELMRISNFENENEMVLEVRKARVFAIEVFKKAENTNGGYKFNE